MSDSQSPPQSPSVQTFFPQAGSVSIGPHATFIHVEGNQKTYQTFQQERECFKSDEEVPEDAFNPSTGSEAQKIFERDLRTISQPYIHPDHYDVSRRSCSTVDGQPSSELRVVSSGRDHNVNNGSGNFNVHNTSLIQQARPIQWYIRGTDEEEEKYDQYNEYRRSDIRLLRKIHHEILSEWDRETRRYVRLDCERSVWLGEIMSGDQKGTIVTVVCYQGHNTSEEWKNTFKCYSVDFKHGDSAHLVGLNRSKIPQLILSGDLVPAAVFARNLEWLEHFGCTGEELCMDTGRGVLFRGPEHSEDGQPRPADGTVFAVALAMNTPVGMLMSENLSAGLEVREIQTNNALHPFGLDCLKIDRLKFSSLSIIYKDLQPVVNLTGNAGFLYLMLVLYKYFRRTHDAIRA
ncbi:hypothetical protein PM082_007051 [Marasmius tenuissimus]|nr:hypothetical protein PM082_007051 [Marasmius tenuissimus]